MNSENERRASPRYTLKNHVEFRVVGEESASAWSLGTTINMNSDSILFQTDYVPATGLNVEVRMAWPLHAPDSSRGTLLLQGVVSWTSEDRCAVTLQRREFLPSPAA